MQTLNLPSFQYNLKKDAGKVLIFDIIRKKYVVLTPEEWVRQHFLHFMINNLQYPRTLIRIEGGLVYNRLNKRSDIVVYDRGGLPWMLVECKAPNQKINEAVVRQASMYNTTLKAKYITVSNGLLHYCARTNWSDSTIELLKNLPEYQNVAD